MASIYIGRLDKGTAAEMMVRAPFMSPAPPNLATTLLAMSILDDFATPHNREPTSNMAKKPRNVILESKYV